MAIRLFPCSGISCGLVFHKVQITKPSIAHPSHKQQPKRTSTTIIGSFNPNNKVFEDSSRGIVCYVDDGGDVICEGYDEGPRYSHPPARHVSHQRAPETFDFLQQPSKEIMASILDASESEFQFQWSEPYSWTPLISQHKGEPT